jgi:tyrosyl-tRNA synthetase
MENYDSICSIGEEIINKESLLNLLQNKQNIIAYDGFEPSGRMHIAQGLLRAHNVNKLTKAGIKFKFYVADFFAQMNLKLGGDIKKIRQTGEQMIKIWKACGMDMNNVEFIWASEEIVKRSAEYWSLVLDIATKFNLTRVLKCTQIMGREESDDLSASQIFYPIMQCADIFFLNVDICSLGIDQRKVNMLALEYCDKIKRKNKPIIISHPMLLGLDGTKMSKSKPDNAIFIDDNPNEIKRKINKAFCEPTNIKTNPILEWSKHIIFPIIGHFIIPANKKFNELEKKFNSYQELENDFKEGTIYPNQLKAGMITHLLDLLIPIQDKLNSS